MQASFAGASIYILNGALATIQILSFDQYDLPRNTQQPSEWDSQQRYFSAQSFAWNRLTGQV
jgi:hypothetical protein